MDKSLREAFKGFNINQMFLVWNTTTLDPTIEMLEIRGMRIYRGEEPTVEFSIYYVNGLSPKYGECSTLAKMKVKYPIIAEVPNFRVLHDIAVTVSIEEARRVREMQMEAIAQKCSQALPNTKSKGVTNDR